MTPSDRTDQDLIELVVFDLDDTLFLELDFVRSGFRHIANLTAESAIVSANEIFEFLWMVSQERRGDVIERLLAAFPSTGRAWSVEELVRTYRCHVPDIGLYPGVRELLQELREAGVRLGVITDGPPVAQRGKLEALRIMELVECVVVTDEFGIEYRKPSTFAFERLSNQFGMYPRSCIYIGDNPAKDFAAGRALGWQTLRLRTAGQLHELAEAASPEFAPEAEVTSIAALRNHLLAQAKMQRIKAAG